VFGKFWGENGGTAIAIYFHPFRRRDANPIKEVKTEAAIPEDLLHGDIVDAEWFSRLDVGYCFIKGKAIGIK
jgi:hypothetical protein